MLWTNILSNMKFLRAFGKPSKNVAPVRHMRRRRQGSDVRAVDVVLISHDAIVPAESTITDKDIV